VPLRCPACGHEYIAGQDTCDNCGASLRVTEDLSGPSFLDRLLGEHLAAVGGEPPATIDAGASARAAIDRMHLEGIGCLLVTSGERVVGIFTDRDAILKAAGHAIDDLDVRDLMTPDPITLGADETLAVAIHKMADGGYRHLPIMGPDGPVGIVTAKDIFRHVLALAG
jgi:CBS domain-containing protein